MIDDPAVDVLSLAGIADSFGVRAPSLYKHVRGLSAVERGVTVRAKEELAGELAHAAVGAARDDAVRALAAAYRTWARSHPGQYPLTTRVPAADDPRDAAVSSRLSDIVYAVLRGYGLDGDALVDATRFFRSTLHGFVSLETGSAFGLPVDLDRSFDHLVDGVISALSHWGGR